MKRNSVQKVFRGLALCLAFLIGTIVTMELLIRAWIYFGGMRGPGETGNWNFQHRAIVSSIQPRIQAVSKHPKSVDQHPFTTANYKVFVNADFGDEERLQFIAQNALYPANGRWFIPDFLRSPDQLEGSRYLVTTDSWGFRAGPNIQTPKPKNEYRILLLGSYIAFGHGVNDEQTYASILEHCLNQSQNKRHVVVLNAGKQAGTSIVGYSFLKFQGDRIQPDLILWDYGLVEHFIGSDGQNRPGPNKEYKNIRNGASKIQEICERPPMLYSSLCKILVMRAIGVNRDAATEGWREAMRRLHSWSLARSLPVLFFRYVNVTIDPSEYEKFNDPANRFVFLSLAPPFDRPLTPEETSEFWSRPNWIQEFPHDRDELMRHQDFLALFTNALLFNQIAHRRFGQYICDNILKTGWIHD